MRLMVFGGDGQLGQQLAELCLRLQVAAKFLSKSEASIVDASVSKHIIDWEPTVLVNAAAYTKVDQAEDERDLAYFVNYRGPANLAALARQFSIPLIHISTDYVFNGNKQGPYVETDQTAPIGVYGQSKEAGERAVRELVDHHMILRTSWLYSRYGSNFLKTMIRLAEVRSEWNVVDDQIGSPTCCIDLAEAIMRVADSATRGDEVWGTYHFAGKGEASWFEFAKAIIKAQSGFTNRHPTLHPIASDQYPSRVVRPRNSCLDCNLFESTFRFSAAPWERRVVEVVGSLFAPISA